MTSFHLHLVSDATGETLSSMSTAALVQFEDASPITHSWTMIRTSAALRRVIREIEAAPGLVACTLVDHHLRDELAAACRQLGLPFVSVMDPMLSALGTFLGAEVRELPGRQHAMNDEYFGRIDAIHFCLAHDDGQALDSLEQADVVLIGVSRTSKTPTSIYLANRGIKAANYPFVPGVPVPPQIEALRAPLVVGLTASPERLIQIRKNRLLTLNQTDSTDYVDVAQVKDEVAQARRLFARHRWPVIDVTRRSIEETAAAILGHYRKAHEGPSISS